MNPFATPERNRWSAAQALGADDLSREQDYHRAATARTAWAAMGAGVVAGLEVTVDGNGDVSVGPGLAIDALGREIVVPSGAGLSRCCRRRSRSGSPTRTSRGADPGARRAGGVDGPRGVDARAVAGVSARPPAHCRATVADLVRAGDVAGALALVAEHRPLPAGASRRPARLGRAGRGRRAGARHVLPADGRHRRVAPAAHRRARGDRPRSVAPALGRRALGDALAAPQDVGRVRQNHVAAVAAVHAVAPAVAHVDHVAPRAAL